MEKRFDELLLEYLDCQDGPKRKSLEETLWKEYGAERAVLVMDLSGFSTLTEKFGIVHNLAIIRRMQLTARPIIEAGGGRVVKFEADNCFAMFEGVYPAVQAAIAIHRAMDDAVVHSSEPIEIRVGIGIDYGEVLLTAEDDYFGMAVNRASKLGEDMAGAHDILITEMALKNLPPDCEVQAEPLASTPSRLNLTVYSIRH